MDMYDEIQTKREEVKRKNKQEMHTAYLERLEVAKK